jgi:hypothetical protein
MTGFRLSAAAFFTFSAGIWHGAAQELGRWQFTDAVVDGQTVHVAAIRAANAVASGSAADYVPIYSLSCTVGDPVHWKHQLQLEEALSSRGLIAVSLKLDHGEARDLDWTVTGTKRQFTRFDVPLVSELKRARSLSLAWNWGWTWLWISDEATFDLSTVRSVIYTLAKACGVPEP